MHIVGYNPQIIYDTFHKLNLRHSLGRRFGASGVHLGPPVAWAAVRSKAVVLLLLTFCLLLLPFWESVIVLCLVYVTLCPF